MGGLRQSTKGTDINGLTFYDNGPGGAVDYSDDFPFNLHGRILHVEFDGPYISDKHPSENTAKLEPELLTTFRNFPRRYRFDFLEAHLH